MSAYVRMTALEIVNEVRRRLGVNTVTTFTDDKLARVLMQLLNEVIAEVNDYGDWQELYQEVLVTASTSVPEYSVRASGGKEVHHILEVAFNNKAGELQNRSIEEIRRLRRSGGVGTPRQFTIKGTDASGNPVMAVHPQPGASQNNQTFNVALYFKEPLLTEASTATVPVFPGNLLVLGLYAKGLLEENGGEPTRQYQMAFAEYQKFLREAVNRFTTDTGSSIRIIPNRRG